MFGRSGHGGEEELGGEGFSGETRGRTGEEPETR